MLINPQKLRVGDIIIISRFSDLRIAKVLRLPLLPNKTYFKVCFCDNYNKYNSSLDRDEDNVKRMNVENFTKIAYLDFMYKDVWLVKRENE